MHRIGVVIALLTQVITQQHIRTHRRINQRSTQPIVIRQMGRVIPPEGASDNHRAASARDSRLEPLAEHCDSSGRAFGERGNVYLDAVLLTVSKCLLRFKRLRRAKKAVQVKHIRGLNRSNNGCSVSRRKRASRHTLHASLDSTIGMQLKPAKPRLRGYELRIDGEVLGLRGKLSRGRRRPEYLQPSSHTGEVMVNMPVNQRTRTRVLVEPTE